MTKDSQKPNERQTYISDRATSITYTCSVDLVHRNENYGQFSTSSSNTGETETGISIHRVIVVVVAIIIIVDAVVIMMVIVIMIIIIEVSKFLLYYATQNVNLI